MSQYKVSWDKGSLELQTERAAILLVSSFREEGREATAYVRSGSDWTEIS